MKAAFTTTKAARDPYGKWTAGDVSNFSALFFAGWNAHLNYSSKGEFTMDDVSRLALEANNQTTTLRQGQTIHVDGIPYELLDDVKAFSATAAAALRTSVEGESE